jgi:hypothetical protein
MRYGIATCPACVAMRLMTSGSRRVWVMASSWRWVRVRMVTSWLSGIVSVSPLSGTTMPASTHLR